MTPEDFDRLQNLMASRAGFRLTRERMKLAEHRLGPVARREGFETVHRDDILKQNGRRVAGLNDWAQRQMPSRMIMDRLANVVGLNRWSGRNRRCCRCRSAGPYAPLRAPRLPSHKPGLAFAANPR